jgi:DNA-binding response OmpR family regulator/DNA-binding CsgD family transcriptional regulator
MSQRVLIIDDDQDTRELLADFASGEGIEPVCADSGEAALALLGAMHPDLILLDAVMPGLDGFETCRRIKARPDLAHVPVIFMTGLSDTDHVVEGLAAGGVDYVTKPLSLAELAARMRVHMANARTTRGALSVVDGSRGLLITTDDSGAMLMVSPEARRLLDELSAVQTGLLLDALRALASGVTGPAAECRFEHAGASYKLAPLGAGASSGTMLFEFSRSGEGLECRLLQEAFGLTPREADVLRWTARGKSNKDTSEILNISARTVNKHLEQVFVKVGVENRAAAAAAATRVLLTA